MLKEGRKGGKKILGKKDRKEDAEGRKTGGAKEGQTVDNGCVTGGERGRERRAW